MQILVGFGGVTVTLTANKGTTGSSCRAHTYFLLLFPYVAEFHYRDFVYTPYTSP